MMLLLLKHYITAIQVLGGRKTNNVACRSPPYRTGCDEADDGGKKKFPLVLGEIYIS